MPTPCESCPLRLASTRLSATVCASSGLLPAAAMTAVTCLRSVAAWMVCVMNCSHHRADLPGHELILPIAVFFALGQFARSRGQHELEDPLAHLLDRSLAVDDL